MANPSTTMMPKQALTNEEADARSARNQKVSPLLRLPAELRNRILEYAFDVGTVRFNFVTTEKRLTSTFSTDTPVNSGAKWISDLQRRTTVCRQIRSETAVLPVKLNTLAVDISQLVDMLNAMPKEFRDEIQALSIGTKFHYGANVMIQEINMLAKLPSLSVVSMQTMHFCKDVNQLVKNALRKWAGDKATVKTMVPGYKKWAAWDARRSPRGGPARRVSGDGKSRFGFDVARQ